MFEAARNLLVQSEVCGTQASRCQGDGEELVPGTLRGKTHHERPQQETLSGPQASNRGNNRLLLTKITVISENKSVNGLFEVYVCVKRERNFQLCTQSKQYSNTTIEERAFSYVNRFAWNAERSTNLQQTAEQQLCQYSLPLPSHYVMLAHLIRSNILFILLMYNCYNY